MPRDLGYMANPGKDIHPSMDESNFQFYRHEIELADPVPYHLEEFSSPETFVRTSLLVGP